MVLLILSFGCNLLSVLNKTQSLPDYWVFTAISNHHVYALTENEPWLLLEVTSTIRFWLGPRLVYSSIQQKEASGVRHLSSWGLSWATCSGLIYQGL